MVGLHHLWDHGAATQSFAIRAACPHPDYNRETMENDLLLLQVGFAPAAGLGRVPAGRLVPGSTAGGGAVTLRRAGCHFLSSPRSTFTSR